MSGASSTIAAIATPPGPGRRGILRVSGPRAAELVRGTLRDGYGNWFADVVARLEDDGDVTGYARTNYGYYDLRGWWDFNRYHETGEFELAFDYGDSKEARLEGSFRGRHAYWNGEWELDYRY